MEDTHPEMNFFWHKDFVKGRVQNDLNANQCALCFSIPADFDFRLKHDFRCRWELKYMNENGDFAKGRVQNKLKNCLFVLCFPIPLRLEDDF